MSTIHFATPASTWLEALPLGNGALGAMCWGGLTTARFDLNEETVWSGSPASEALQIPLDAAASAAALENARQLLNDGDPVEAGTELMRMQSAYGQAYLPLATLEVDVTSPGADPEQLTVDATGRNFRRELDLTRAIHTVSGEAHGAAMRQWTLISAEYGVMMHVLEGLPFDVTPRVRLSTSLRVLHSDVDVPDQTTVMQMRMPADVAPTHEPEFPALRYSERQGDSLEGAVIVRVIEDTDADGARRLAIFLGAATTYDFATHGIEGSAADAETRARDLVDTAVRAGIDAVAARHLKDHAELFGRVELVLGEPSAASTDVRLARAVKDPAGPLVADPALAALLFDYGRYLLLSCSRPGGLPATLQGIWNDSMQPPWSSNYTLNINFEMNYWGAEAANLPESAQPMTAFVSALASRGRGAAARLYGASGWVAHHNTDAWLMTSPVGGGRGDPSWAFWPMAGPWLVRALWDQVEFGSADQEMVRETLWPVILPAAEFALDWMTILPDGSWGTSPSTSPENTFVGPDGRPASVSQSSAMDISLLRDLFGIVAAASQMVGAEDDSVVHRAAARLREMGYAPAVGAHGTVREWLDDVDDVDPHHRHVSHLYALYPGKGIDDEAVLRAVEASLDGRGDDSTGWSLVWKIALWARLRRPDRVSDLLRLVFRSAGTDEGPWSGGLYPNLFAAHPPFQIDGNLGYVAAVAESLLQSHRGGIELLPALPAEWKNGRVVGLVARPGIVVGITWRDGNLVAATLTPRSDAQAGVVAIVYGRKKATMTVAPGVVTRLDLHDFAAGE